MVLGWPQHQTSLRTRCQLTTVFWIWRILSRLQRQVYRWLPPIKAFLMCAVELQLRIVEKRTKGWFEPIRKLSRLISTLWLQAIVDQGQAVPLACSSIEQWVPLTSQMTWAPTVTFNQLVRRVKANWIQMLTSLVAKTLLSLPSASLTWPVLGQAKLEDWTLPTTCLEETFQLEFAWTRWSLGLRVSH